MLAFLIPEGRALFELKSDQLRLRMKASQQSHQVALPLYALMFLTEVIWLAIVPLAPTYAQMFGLSRLELGSVLASAGVATVVVALPVGLLADRFGARPLILASSVTVVVSTLGQGFAGDFWSLLLSRAAFGFAIGASLTAGLAWFSEVGGSASLGTSITVAAVGAVVGPAFAGLLADALGVRAPFLVLAAAAASVTFFLIRHPWRFQVRYRREPLATTLKGGRRENLLLGSMLVMALIGVTSGGVNLLVPLQLRAEGLSSGATGLAMSASASVFVVCSAVVTRLHARAATLRVVGLAALCYGGAMLLGVVATSTAAVIAFVLLRAPFWATLSTLAYPLGAIGAKRAAVGRGAVMGLLNVVWGVAVSVGPVMAGALAQAAGVSWAFGALAALCGVAGMWLVSAGSACRVVDRDVSPARADGGPR